MPYRDHDPRDREHNEMMYPHMDAKRVFLDAVRGMGMSTQAVVEVANTRATGAELDPVLTATRRRRPSR